MLILKAKTLYTYLFWCFRLKVFGKRTFIDCDSGIFTIPFDNKNFPFYFLSH